MYTTSGVDANDLSMHSHPVDFEELVTQTMQIHISTKNVDADDLSM